MNVGILSPDSLGQRLCNNLIMSDASEEVLQPAKRPECEDSKENEKLHTWRDKPRITKCLVLGNKFKNKLKPIFSSYTN